MPFDRAAEWSLEVQDAVLLLVLALYFGWRPVTLLKLTTAHFRDDPERGVIWVQEPPGKTLGDGQASQDRQVPL